MKSSFSFIKDARFPMMIVSVLAGVLFVTMAVNASTTISTNVSTGGTLDVTGLTTLANASTTRISLTSNLMVNGMATTTGSTGAIATGYLVCSTATGLQAGDTVFVQATSSFPGNFVVQAASSTVAGVISIRILNVATTSFRVADSTDATGPNTLNFWAVR